MALQAFTFPFAETRFIKAGSFIYKFKLRTGSSFSGEEAMRGHCFNQEMEEIIRTVLGNLNSLQPFSSTHFNVFPYKKRWEGLSKVMCRHYKRKMRAYPFILILYLEKNRQNGKQAEEKLTPEEEIAQQIPSASKPQSKRRKTDSALEDAILQHLMRDLEAENKASMVRLHMDNPHTENPVQEDPRHVDKKGTKRFEKPQQKSGTSMTAGTAGEVHPGTAEDMGEEEEVINADSDPETPTKPGILTRMASHIFPFSLFFRDP